MNKVIKINLALLFGLIVILGLTILVVPLLSRKTLELKPIAVFHDDITPHGSFYPLSYKFLHSDHDIDAYFSYGDKAAKLRSLNLDFSNYTFLVSFGKRVLKAYHSPFAADPTPRYARKWNSWFVTIVYEDVSVDDQVYIYRTNKNQKLRGYEGPG